MNKIPVTGHKRGLCIVGFILVKGKCLLRMLAKQFLLNDLLGNPTGVLVFCHPNSNLLPFEVKFRIGLSTTIDVFLGIHGKSQPITVHIFLGITHISNLHPAVRFLNRKQIGLGCLFVHIRQAVAILRFLSAFLNQLALVEKRLFILKTPP